MRLVNGLRNKRAQFKKSAEQVLRAIRPQKHNDALVLSAWDGLGGDTSKEDAAFGRLNAMLARSTGSINNSYLKVQIASGVVVGLIALFLTVFSQQPGANLPLLVVGSVMEALGIGLSFMVTTPRKTTWMQVVESPGVYAATITRREEYLSLSRHVFYNRVVLLRNRRISWSATWGLTVPGLIVAMLAWAWLATCVALVLLVAIRWAYKRLLVSSEPENQTDVDDDQPEAVYPSS